MKKFFTILLILSIIIISFILFMGNFDQTIGKLLIILCSSLIATSLIKIFSSK